MKTLSALILAALGMVIGASMLSPVAVGVQGITTAAYGASVASVATLISISAAIAIIMYTLKGVGD